MQQNKVLDLIELGTSLDYLAKDQSEWSQATFGNDKVRGPVGALKHLEKEAREAYQRPNDLIEYADCFLLILDAARRAGISPLAMIKAAQAKLEVNKQREWPKPIDDEPVEHIKKEDEC